MNTAEIRHLHTLADLVTSIKHHVYVMKQAFAPPPTAEPPFGLPADPSPVQYFGLDKLGRRRRKPPEFTFDQMARIRQCYAAADGGHVDLVALSKELGKSRQNISRFARLAGLTKRNRTPSERALAAIRQPRWSNKPHPRGMLGKKHSADALEKMSKAGKLTWATWKTFGLGHMSPEGKEAMSARCRAMITKRPASTMYTRTKGGHRADLAGIYFRSSWEANYARYLNLLIRLGIVETWEFEPETFWFEGINRGVCSYRPDFRVKYKGEDRHEYVEIKGWIVAKDRTKWARMKKYHPHIKLIVVKAKQYYAIQKKWASCIPNWENPKK